MRVTRWKNHLPDPGGRASARAVNRPARVAALECSAKAHIRLRLRIARTRSLPMLESRQTIQNGRFVIAQTQ
jgi:hypothetical protein